MRFVPLDIESNAGAALYQLCRAEGWLSSHGAMDRYDGAAILCTGQGKTRLHILKR